jgi:hypothetical protein
MGDGQPCGKTHARPARKTGGDSGEMKNKNRLLYGKNSYVAGQKLDT